MWLAVLLSQFAEKLTLLASKSFNFCLHVFHLQTFAVKNDFVETKLGYACKKIRILFQREFQPIVLWHPFMLPSLQLWPTICRENNESNLLETRSISNWGILDQCPNCKERRGEQLLSTTNQAVLPLKFFSLLAPIIS